eukprot:m.127149 g.127149  ORF g.127149 m.127149 type:complete len:1045 (-) comp15795_c0_seq1:193-3327(-)
MANPVGEKLARGGFGVVHDLGNNQVIKTAEYNDFLPKLPDRMKPHAKAYFKREHDICAKLKEAQDALESVGRDMRGVVRFIGVDLEDDNKTLKIIMEKLVSLKELLKQEYMSDGNPPLFKIVKLTKGCRINGSLALKMLADVGAGLTALHSMGFVHRDVSYSNIMAERTSNGISFKLIDLGLGREFCANSDMSELLSQPDHATPPEVLYTPGKRNQKTYQKGDIWSLAAVVVRCLLPKEFWQPSRQPNGNVPDKGKLKHWATNISKHLETSAPQVRPDWLRDSIAQLLQAMLAIDPESRPTAAMVAKYSQALLVACQPEMVSWKWMFSSVDDEAVPTKTLVRNMLPASLNADKAYSEILLDCLKRIHASQDQSSLLWIQSPSHPLAVFRDDPSDFDSMELCVLQVAALEGAADLDALSLQLDDLLLAELKDAMDQDFVVVLPEVDESTDLTAQSKAAMLRVHEVQSFSLTALELWDALYEKSSLRLGLLASQLAAVAQWCINVQRQAQSVLRSCMLQQAEVTSLHRLQMLTNLSHTERHVWEQRDEQLNAIEQAVEQLMTKVAGLYRAVQKAEVHHESNHILLTQAQAEFEPLRTYVNVTLQGLCDCKEPLAKDAIQVAGNTSMQLCVDTFVAAKLLLSRSQWGAVVRAISNVNGEAASLQQQANKMALQTAGLERQLDDDLLAFSQRTTDEQTQAQPPTGQLDELKASHAKDVEQLTASHAQDVDQLTADHAQAMQHSEELVTRLSARLQDVSKQLVKQSALAETSQAQLKEHKDIAAKAAKTNKKLVAKIQKLRATVEGLRAEVEALSQQPANRVLESTRAELKACIAKLAKLESSPQPDQQLVQQCAAVQADNERLTLELRAAQRRWDDNNSDQTDFVEKLRDGEQRAREAEDIAAAMANRAQDLEAALEALQKRTDDEARSHAEVVQLLQAQGGLAAGGQHRQANVVVSRIPQINDHIIVQWDNLWQRWKALGNLGDKPVLIAGPCADDWGWQPSGPPKLVTVHGLRFDMLGACIGCVLVCIQAALVDIMQMISFVKYCM